MKILITGGTGFIGKELCKSVLAHGHKVTVLSRQPQTVSERCGDQVAAQGLAVEHEQPATDDHGDAQERRGVRPVAPPQHAPEHRERQRGVR